MKDIMKNLQKRYAIVREKHPVFIKDNNIHEAVSILTEEVGEVAQAVNDNANNLRSEIYDVMVVCVRMLEELNKG